MNSPNDELSMTVTRKKRLVIMAITGCGSIGALLALAVATSSHRIDGGVGLALLAAFAFNLLAWLVRCLVTSIRRRLFLIGRYPVAVGLARLSGFAAVSLLVLLCVAGFAIGGEFKNIALRALVFGALSFVFLSLMASGLMNALVVFRYFQGTLPATSREVARNSGQSAS